MKFEYIYFENIEKGPLMIDPNEVNSTGLHDDPVCVLDFESLYPSVMVTFNLCYTTLLVLKWINKNINKI